MRPIVYDLTEALLASTGRFRFYGIARTATEIAMGLQRLDPSIRFGVWVRGHDVFHEVQPRVLDDGSIDLNVPSGVRQLRLRRHYPRANPVRDAALAVARPIVAAINRRRWNASGGTLRPIDLEGAILTTPSRPKLIADFADVLARRGTTIGLVPLLYDLIPLHETAERNGSFASGFLVDNRRVIEASEAILAISRFTASEIEGFAARNVLPTPPRIVPIPLVHECPEGDGPPASPPAEPFLLAVGSATGRKNLEAVFEALLHLGETGRAVPLLVLAGAARKRTHAMLATERYAPIRDRVVYRENPQQADLVALYRAALAVVVPSRIEGWGLPAGEALWFGTPAICADIPALREVAGDLGLYFDPDDPRALAAHVTRLMGDEPFATALRAHIEAAHGMLRRWTDVARDYHDALLRIA